jgi:UDP-glucose 4-epimerase
LLEKIIREVNVVIHLAAQIHVDRSIVEPKLTYEINVLGTLNLLEIARHYDVEKMIHASTSEVYGTAQYSPIDEKHPLSAPHPYGASKIAADRTCYAFMQTYGLNVCILRPFNTFGPFQKDTGYGGAISIFVKRVFGNQPPIVYGDGKQTRDYVYVEDIIDGYMSVLKSNCDTSEPINLGTGKDIPVLELANTIIELSGKKGVLYPVHVAARPGEVRCLCADTNRAKELIDWKPKYTLEAGLKEFIKWYYGYRFEEWSKPG